MASLQASASGNSPAPVLTASASLPPAAGSQTKKKGGEPSSSEPSHVKHKRRFCKHEGCTRIVKSQGLCQRHGAKPRICKVKGCDKQAQGNFDKMCKAHFKEMKRQTTPLPQADIDAPPPPPQGFSVYDSIVPESVRYVARPNTVLPLIAHLKHGFDTLKPPAWHRNEERLARGMHPVTNPATQLEGWERELVWMEILILTGAPGASFRHLARAWGRDKGFHMVLAQFICERQGDVERKKRRNAGGDSSKAKGADGKPPARKRARTRTRRRKDGLSGIDNWMEDNMYGEFDANESLAADLFNFSNQDYEQKREQILDDKDFQAVIAGDHQTADAGVPGTNQNSQVTMNMSHQNVNRYAVPQGVPQGDHTGVVTGQNNSSLNIDSQNIGVHSLAEVAAAASLIPPPSAQGQVAPTQPTPLPPQHLYEEELRQFQQNAAQQQQHHLPHPLLQNTSQNNPQSHAPHGGHSRTSSQVNVNPSQQLQGHHSRNTSYHDANQQIMQQQQQIQQQNLGGHPSYHNGVAIQQQQPPNENLQQPQSNLGGHNDVNHHQNMAHSRNVSYHDVNQQMMPPQNQELQVNLQQEQQQHSRSASFHDANQQVMHQQQQQQMNQVPNIPAQMPGHQSQQHQTMPENPVPQGNTNAGRNPSWNEIQQVMLQAVEQAEPITMNSRQNAGASTQNVHQGREMQQPQHQEMVHTDPNMHQATTAQSSATSSSFQHVNAPAPAPNSAPPVQLGQHSQNPLPPQGNSQQPSPQVHNDTHFLPQQQQQLQQQGVSEMTSQPQNGMPHGHPSSQSMHSNVSSQQGQQHSLVAPTQQYQQMDQQSAVASAPGMYLADGQQEQSAWNQTQQTGLAHGDQATIQNNGHVLEQAPAPIAQIQHQNQIVPPMHQQHDIQGQSHLQMQSSQDQFQDTNPSPPFAPPTHQEIHHDHQQQQQHHVPHPQVDHVQREHHSNHIQGGEDTGHFDALDELAHTNQPHDDQHEHAHGGGNHHHPPPHHHPQQQQF